MSLDVYLSLRDSQLESIGSGIFIREDGRQIEITREEWDKRFPGREPVRVLDRYNDTDVYTANITHNLNQMAENAGLYKPLWRPEEIGITTAAQLIEPLRTGLALLKSDPHRFKEYNPPNGWGSYEGLVNFVEAYLEACQKNPDAEISVSR